MTFPSLKTAFILHFLVSLLIFAVLVTLMVKVWFPGDLFTMDGGWQGLKIIAPIDLVLGPALTLLFYRPQKKGVLLDLGAILLLQSIALSYGVYTAYQQRTAAIVFAENRFETVSLREFNLATKDIQDKKLTPIATKDFGAMPIIVYARPFDSEDYGQYLEDLLNGLPELRERNDRYASIIEARDAIEEYRIGATPDGTTIEVPAGGKLNNEPAENLAFPIKARYNFGTITFYGSDFETFDIERNEE